MISFYGMFIIYDQHFQGSGFIINMIFLRFIFLLKNADFDAQNKFSLIIF